MNKAFEQAAGVRLRITEIFLSLQGEARDVGRPTVFVRLTGCPLRCHWCDTEYAFSGGDWMTLAAVIQQVSDFGVQHVTVTGGEPLAQPGCIDLLTALCDAQLSVSLETSGALDISQVDGRVTRVMDIKPPGSGEVDKNRWENLDFLRPRDEVKFVISHRADYEWCAAVLREHELAKRCEVLFSPVHGQLPAQALADWIVADRLPVRFQIQLHKYLWGDARGR